MRSAQSCYAKPWCWVTADLYEQQIFIGVFAVAQACCEPFLQSSTEQWEMHFAKISVAVHWWWVTAHLYGHQVFMGAFALTQGCCQPVLQSSDEQWGMHFALSSDLPNSMSGGSSRHA